MLAARVLAIRAIISYSIIHIAFIQMTAPTSGRTAAAVQPVFRSIVTQGDHSHRPGARVRPRAGG